MSALTRLSDQDLVSMPEGSLRLHQAGEHVVYFWSEDKNVENIIRAFAYNAKIYTLLAHPSHDERRPIMLQGRYLYRARLPQIAAHAAGQNIDVHETYQICDAHKVTSYIVRHTTHDAIEIVNLGQYVRHSSSSPYGRRHTDGFGRAPYG